MPKGFDAERMAQGPEWDRILLASLVLLAGTGLATLLSASSNLVLKSARVGYSVFFHQLIVLLPSIVLFLLCALLPLEVIRSKVGPLTILSLIFLLTPFIPGLGELKNGANRWIDVAGNSFQPSELWKPVSVLYLAHIMDRRREDLEAGPSSIVLPFLLVGLGCLIIFLQNDLSTAAIVGLAAFVVFWVGGAPLSFFIGLGAVVTPLFALSVLTSDFRLRRILAFLFPSYDLHGQSYQVLGSIRAIQSGGFLGKGIGLGTLKNATVPEVQTDFIFSAWTEETGFIGVLLFIALWCLFAWRCYRQALSEEKGFRAYLGFGLATLLLIQVLLNIAMAAGSIPATGIPLPFFSSGGSSLLASSCVVGLLVNLSRPLPAKGGSNV